MVASCRNRDGVGVVANTTHGDVVTMRTLDIHANVVRVRSVAIGRKTVSVATGYACRATVVLQPTLASALVTDSVGSVAWIYRPTILRMAMVAAA